MKTTDQMVKQLFDSVQAKKLAIEKAEKPCWQTSCNFGFSADSAHERKDIRILNDTRKIVDMLAFLMDRKEKSERAANELGVDYSFSWLGFSLEEWKSDFQTRINQISIQERKRELAEIEARLNAIISPELKAKMELEVLTELLNKK